jgi:hypothetical protein
MNEALVCKVPKILVDYESVELLLWYALESFFGFGFDIGTFAYSQCAIAVGGRYAVPRRKIVATLV